MSEGLESIIHDAYVKERKLTALYSMLIEQEEGSEECPFLGQACDEQDGNLQVLRDINRKYGDDDIDPGIFEKLGESVKRLKTQRHDREELIREILEIEGELVEGYKQSLRFLTTDDQTRKLVNKMLTVKLGHKRDLLDLLSK